MSLQQKQLVIDLNSHVFYRYGYPLLYRSIIAHEYRSNSLCASTRFSTQASISLLCSAIPWQPSRQVILLLRSIFIDGFCPADLSRKLARYRNLPARIRRQIISLWFSRKDGSQYVGQRQRKTTLANLPGLRTHLNHTGKIALHRRRLRHHAGQHCLRFGLYDHRFMPDIISMGAISQTQKCRQSPYADGPERLDSVLYTRYRRRYARCEYHAGTAAGTIGVLRHGQSLYRLCCTLQFYKEQCVLCHTSKEQSGFHAPKLSFGRQNDRSSMRSDHQTDRTEKFKTVSCFDATHRLPGHRIKQTIRIPDQQFYVGCIDYLPALQMPMADRTVLQVDQATLANQIVFRHLNQRRQDPDMDRNQYLCACSDYQKRIRNPAISGRNTANSQHSAFRENLAVSSTYVKLFTKQRTRKL